MISLLYFALVLVSGFGIGAAFMIADDRLLVILLTTWVWTVIYGTTYYQVKVIMWLFKRKKY